jgi:hypothetical protein
LNKISLQQAINRIVFGIKSPINKYEYLLKNEFMINENSFVKVKLSDEPNDIVIFKCKDDFE